MSLYGINNYTNLYSSLYSKKSFGNSGNSNDLYNLMKKVDEVRSPAYAKKIQEQLKNGVSEESGEVGTVASELKLSQKASALYKSAASLNGISDSEISDPDTLVKKVTAFVDSYNSAVDALQGSDSVDALKSGVSMTNTAKSYSNALNRIGINLGSDNKFTVNKDVLKNSDPNSVKSMLTGNYSPITRIASKAEQISQAATNKARTTSFTQMLYSNNKSVSPYSSYNSYNNYASSFIGALFDQYL